MSRSLIVCSSADRREHGGSCVEGQLIGMTEWTFPHPEPEAGREVPCPRR
jgi:hypothetical protein